MHKTCLAKWFGVVIIAAALIGCNASESIKVEISYELAVDKLSALFPEQSVFEGYGVDRYELEQDEFTIHFWESAPPFASSPPYIQAKPIRIDWTKICVVERVWSAYGASSPDREFLQAAVEAVEASFDSK